MDKVKVIFRKNKHNDVIAFISRSESKLWKYYVIYAYWSA